MKKLLSILLSSVLLICTLSSTTVFAEGDNEFSFDFEEVKTPEIPVYVDGKQLMADVPAQIISDRTMVPLRAIFEAIGADVAWDDSTKTAISNKGETTVKITIGEYRLIKNDTEIAIDVPAQIVDSRTLVPVRAIAESFDCTVEWLDDIRTVRILSKVLPDPELTPADEKIVYYLNDTPVSQARYDLYTAVITEMNGAEPTESNVLGLLKQLYAAEKFIADFGAPLSVFDNDLINTTILNLKDNGVYDAFVAQYAATDAALRSFVKDTTVINLVNSCYHDMTSADLIEIARKEFVKVKHILVKTEEEANEVLEKINNGEVFEELVKQYSIDSMDPDAGYIFTTGDMVKEFEKKSFELKDGEISEPVQSAYGYHIIKKYPMSEVTDEYLLTNYAQKLFVTANSVKTTAAINNIISTIEVKKA